MRAGFIRRAGHSISSADRAAKRVALYINPSQQEEEKSFFLDPSSHGRHSRPEGDTGRHSQQEVDPDSHFSPQEVAYSDDIPSQPGGASQPDAHLYQQEGASKNDITSQQEGASPNPITILSDQEGERDTVEHGDEDTDNNQLPPQPTWYPRPTHFPDL